MDLNINHLYFIEAHLLKEKKSLYIINHVSFVSDVKVKVIPCFFLNKFGHIT